jgi:hypothetical protein
MRIRFAVSVVFIALWSFSAAAQSPQPGTGTNVSPDKAFTTDVSGSNRIEEAIKPYVQKARESYPQAKQRFLAGLPPKNRFFVVTRLQDEKKRVEQAFIAVESIEDGNITGRIGSRILGVDGYKQGDKYIFPESQLVDWVIMKPGGTEEGNVVGNFLDEYQKTMKTTKGVAAPDRKEPAPASH